MSNAALQSKPKGEAAQGGPKGDGETDRATAGMPAFLGGAVQVAGAPAFLQRQPEEILDEDEVPAEGVLQRLPHDPFPTNGEGDEEEEDALTIQPKLEINRPGDAFEAEADRVADAVTSGGPHQGDGGPSGAPPAIQRACASCGGQAQEQDEVCPDCAAKLQRKEDGAAPRQARSAADVVANPGAGRPLAPETRAPIEAQLGEDLSHVRVHSDSAAQEAAGSITAKAFTHGNDIWLGPGQSADDLGLMAHEATHTVQQGRGQTKPALLQRAPADHQHGEDAAAPRARIEGEINSELEDSGEHDPDEPTPEIDPAEKRAKAAPLEGQAKPDVDRPAQEAPKVNQAAGQVQAEADAPSEQIVEGQSEEPDAGAAPEPQAEESAPQAHVEAAVAQIAALPEPEAPESVAPPPIAAPVDADGQPLPPEAQSEALVQVAAAQLQMAREAAFALRQKAKQQRANAILLRGNIAMADQHIGEAESGLTTAHGAMETRREVISEAENAHATSEEKAATVEAEAPGIQAEAEEAQDESGPMASEASDTAAENDANAPDDPDAAGDSAEAGAQMNSVASDSASMNQASNATQQRAVQLQADVAQARQKNAQAMGQIEGARASADQTDEKLAEMDGQASQARSEVEPLKSAPDEAEARAQALDEQAARADARTDTLAADLAAIQADYVRDMERVPGAQSLSEQNEGQIQRTETDGAPASGGEAPTAYAPRGYEGRRKVQLPNFQIGPPLTEEQRQQRAEEAAAAEARRRARIEALQNGSHGNFSELSATDKAGIALDFMLEDAFARAGKIKWPDFSAASVGNALLNIIDPRGPLNGILGGLSTVASGVLNLFDMDQWARDPLGNLLKSAADIATGITVILGSIVALLGVVVALCAAAIVLSFGALSVPLAGVIAWCTSAGMTVGGWTISVGLLALYYQGLLFIKNIVDVMTAETAEELVVNTEQLEGDFAQVGEIGMQMGTAYLGAKGGPGMLDDIAENGIRRVAQQEVLDGLTDAAIEVGTGEDISGVIGAARMARGVHANARGGGGGGGRADAEGGARPEGDSGTQRPDADAETTPRAEEGDTTPEAPETPDTAPPPPDTGEAAPPSQSAAPAERNPPARPAEGPEPTPSVDMDTQPPRPPEPEADATQRGPEGEPTPEAGGEPSQAPAEPSAGTGGEVQRPDVSTEGPVAPRTEEGGQRRAEGEEAGAPRPEDEGGSQRPQDESGTPAGGAPRGQEADAGTRRPEDSETQTPRPDETADPSALREAAARKRLDEMSPAERRAEAEQANSAPRQEIENQALRDIGFDDVARLDNGMEYIRSQERGSACRVANSGCGPTDGDGRVPEDGLSGDARTEADVDAALAGQDTGTPRPDENAADPPPQGVDPDAPSPVDADTTPRQDQTPDAAAERPHSDLSDAALADAKARYDAEARADGRPDVRVHPDGSIDPVAKSYRWEEYRRQNPDRAAEDGAYQRWSDQYDRIVENSLRGRAEEIDTLNELGLANNNLGATETVRPLGEGTPGTRPDSLPGRHIVDPEQSVHVADVKSMRGGTPDEPAVLYSSDQLRQQHETATTDDPARRRTYERDYDPESGDTVVARQSHAVVISHPDPASVRPSRTLGSDSFVIHRTPPSSPGGDPVYRVWLPDANSPNGGFWSPPRPRDEILGYLRRAYVD